MEFRRRHKVKTGRATALQLLLGLASVVLLCEVTNFHVSLQDSPGTFTTKFCFIEEVLLSLRCLGRHRHIFRYNDPHFTEADPARLIARRMLIKLQFIEVTQNLMLEQAIQPAHLDYQYFLTSLSTLLDVDVKISMLLPDNTIDFSKISRAEAYLDWWAVSSLGYDWSHYNKFHRDWYKRYGAARFHESVGREFILLSKCFQKHLVCNSNCLISPPKSVEVSLTRDYIKPEVVDLSAKFEQRLLTSVDLRTCGYTCSAYLNMNSSLSIPKDAMVKLGEKYAMALIADYRSLTCAAQPTKDLLRWRGEPVDVLLSEGSWDNLFWASPRLKVLSRSGIKPYNGIRSDLSGYWPYLCTELLALAGLWNPLCWAWALISWLLANAMLLAGNCYITLQRALQSWRNFSMSTGSIAGWTFKPHVSTPTPCSPASPKLTGSLPHHSSKCETPPPSPQSPTNKSARTPHSTRTKRRTNKRARIAQRREGNGRSSREGSASPGPPTPRPSIITMPDKAYTAKLPESSATLPATTSVDMNSRKGCTAGKPVCFFTHGLKGKGGKAAGGTVAQQHADAVSCVSQTAPKAARGETIAGTAVSVTGGLHGAPPVHALLEKQQQHWQVGDSSDWVSVDRATIDGGSLDLPWMLTSAPGSPLAGSPLSTPKPDTSLLDPGLSHVALLRSADELDFSLLFNSNIVMQDRPYGAINRDVAAGMDFAPQRKAAHHAAHSNATESWGSHLGQSTSGAPGLDGNIGRQYGNSDANSSVTNILSFGDGFGDGFSTVAGPRVSTGLNVMDASIPAGTTHSDGFSTVAGPRVSIGLNVMDASIPAGTTHAEELLAETARSDSGVDDGIDLQGLNQIINNLLLLTEE